jgi:hypothetical protein
MSDPGLDLRSSVAGILVLADRLERGDVLLIDTPVPSDAPIDDTVLEPEPAANEDELELESPVSDVSDEVDDESPSTVEDAVETEERTPPQDEVPLPLAAAPEETVAPAPVELTGPVYLSALFPEATTELEVDAAGPADALAEEDASDHEPIVDDIEGTDAGEPEDGDEPIHEEDTDRYEPDLALLLPTVAVMPASHPVADAAEPAPAPAPDITALARLEEVRAEIAELSSRRLSILSRRRLAEAQLEERAILTSLGYDSYLDLMLRNAAGARQVPAAESLAVDGGTGGGSVLPVAGGIGNAPVPGAARVSSIPGGASPLAPSGWLAPPPPPPFEATEADSAEATTSAIVDAGV